MTSNKEVVPCVVPKQLMEGQIVVARNGDENGPADVRVWGEFSDSSRCIMKHY
jgi:hypothetical protein